MRKFVSITSLVAVAGCAGASATVSTTLATAQTDLSKAIAVYQTVKGMALVAEVAQPSIAPVVTKAIAVLDPLMATAQQALTSVTADAPTLESMAQNLITQATALMQTAAPAVKVVASKG